MVMVSKTATRSEPLQAARPRNAPSVTLDEIGEFAMINKHDLNVDESYQRSHSSSKIEKMAREWSWVACSTLAVALRPDATWYVMDGQHRKLAAMLRDDIEALPCMVHDVDRISQEARNFVNLNSNRRAMTAVAKFRAMVTGGDPAARIAADLVERAGRRVEVGGSLTTFSAIEVLIQCLRIDESSLRRIWPVVVELCKDHRIPGHVLSGFWRLERAFVDPAESLSDARWRKRIVSVGLAEIESSISQTAALLKTTRSNRVSAMGIATAINRGLRNRLHHKLQIDSAID